jgi:transposase
MLTLPPSVRLYVAPQPVDARKGFNGLSLYVQAQLRLEPLSGHLFVFFNRRRDQVRILFWDRSGYVLWAKRLERGRFRLPEPWIHGGLHAQVEAAELALCLEGIDLSCAKRRPRWTPPVASPPSAK